MAYSSANHRGSACLKELAGCEAEKNPHGGPQALRLGRGRRRDRDKGTEEGGRDRRSQSLREFRGGGQRSFRRQTGKDKDPGEEAVEGECGEARPLGTAPKPKGQVFVISSEGPEPL